MKIIFNFIDLTKEVLPVRLFDHKIDIINSYCNTKNIKVVHILQPLLIYKKNKSRYEQNYYEHWKSEFKTYHYNIEKIFEYYEIIKKNIFLKVRKKKYSIYRLNNFF